MSRHALRMSPVVALAVALAVAVAGATGASACSTTTATATSPVGAKPPIVIGAMAPLTGNQKDLGLLVQNVFRVAEASLNGAGGLLGRPVSLVIRDDGSDPTVASASADFFLKKETGAVGVVGPSTSSSVFAIHERFSAAKRTLITPLALSPLLTSLQAPEDRYLFRTEPSAVLQARAAALFLTQRVGGTTADGGAASACRTFAIVHYDDDSGTGNPVADEFVTAVQARGGSIALRIKVDPAAKAFDDEARRVVAARADCQAILMLAAPGATYMRAFRDLTKDDRSRDWSKFITLGSIAFFQQGFITGSLGAAEGVYGTTLDPEPGNPEYAGFKNLYDTFYPISSNPRPVPPPAAVYDAVMLLALAVQRAGGTEDGPKIRDSVRAVSHGGEAKGAKRFGPTSISDAISTLKRNEEIDYQGASGDCDLDENGDVIADHVIWRVVNGQFATVLKIKASEIAK